jgi:hypothetical protein
MPTLLDAWQSRLETHFGELAKSRAETGFPIFALEHGLDKTELKEISDQLRSELVSGARLSHRWLLWVIYATEQGYEYDGVEYWVSFEENTPYWRERASGRQLRSYFTRFQKAYNGVIPAGPWAEWFRNIAWPITHAILPQYFQVQFARALYDASLQFARMHNPTPAAAGRLLASSAWDASIRFQEFLEQEELSGRIVLALLGLGAAKGQNQIYAPTLDRLVNDLENIRSAGEWLKAARRVVADRLHGLDRSSAGYAQGPDVAPLSRPPQVPPPNVKPALLLRRSSSTSWSVVIETPDFSGVARLSPELSQFLRTTRCTLAGTGGAMLPAGWTLYAPQMRVMKAWPSAGAQMISFERPNAILENILRGECRFPDGPIWVFRLGSDGLAREIAGKTVRPGHDYVILSRGPVNTTLAFAKPTTIQCDGVHAVVLELPEAVERDETTELHKLGVQVVRNIRVWPAGLCVRNWDGEGHGDWLSTEAPSFGIVHDYAVEGYEVRLNHEPEVTIEGTRAGHPIFVRLSPLPPGRHILSVRAKRLGLLTGAQALRDLEGQVELKVRDPTPWKAGTTSHPGLAVSVDPPDPSLDAFWEGNVRLSVMGPEGRDVVCAITLTGKSGAPVLSQEIGRFDLPITPSQWTQRFKNFTNDASRAWKYLEASTGRFVIKGEELGEFALRLEKDAKPVRWICRPLQHTTQVRLVDDTAQEELVETKYFPLRQPAKATPLDCADALADMVAEEPGALYYAAQGQHRDALVVSSSRGAVDFRELVVEPNLIGAPTDTKELLSLIELWHGARLAGPLADSRRELITRRLLARLYDNLCGSRWGHAEHAFFSNPQSEDFQQLERAAEAKGGFAVVLRQSSAKLQQGTKEGSRWFTEVAHRYDICHDTTLCTFALQLAGSPFSIGDKPTALFDAAKNNAPLIRGARLAALHCIAADRDHPHAYLPSWTW